MPGMGRRERNRLQKSRVFFSKSVKKSVKRGVRVLRAREREKQTVFLASLPSLALCFKPCSRPFCLTARAYLNTQKYGLFCSLGEK